MPRVARPRRISPAVLKLSTLIRRAATASYRRELGLQSVEWRALALIGDDGPLTHGALCDLMAQDKGQVSRAVATLVERGWVRRDAVGRQVTLSLLPAAQPAHRRLTEISHRRNRRLLDGLSADEVTAMFRCLDVVTENAHRLVDSDDGAGDGAVGKTAANAIEGPVRPARRSRPSG